MHELDEDQGSERDPGVDTKMLQGFAIFACLTVFFNMSLTGDHWFTVRALPNTKSIDVK